MKKLFFLFLFFISTSYLFTQENISVDCSAGPVSTTFCYMTGDDNSFVITSNDGSALNLSIDEGQVELNWDELIVLDSDGSELYNGYGNGGDVSGLTFQSLGDSLTVLVDEDTSVSCTENGYLPITFTAACATCINPQVNFEMVSDCLNGPQFFVDADVVDLGSASSLTISDNQGNSQSINNAGTVQFGPFPNNTDVQLTVSNDDDANCSVSSGSITQDYCAITLVDCTAGPVSSSYCYPDGDTTQFEYVSSDGSVLNLTIDSGSVENNFDELIILDSDGVTELYNGYGNSGDITGLTFQSSGDTIFFSVSTDGSVSCQGGSASLLDGINYTVACATCVNPSAEYSVIDDCANGDQFLIDVNITDLGSASSVSISDNQGSAGVHVTQTGVTQMGPYPFQTEIIITVSNDEDVNCVINSSPIQLFACPPENDNCDGAITIDANDGEACDSFGSGTLVAATPSPELTTCAGSYDDDVWFEFTAVSENHAISLYNVIGDTQDLYHVVYEGDDCSNLTELYCSDDNNSTVNGLTVGNNYLVRVYSFGSAELTNSTFDICVFTVPPPILTDATLYTVDEIVTDILIDSECDQAFNVTYSTGTNFGSTNGIGYFEANGSSWPFENGLIMTSGEIANAVGPESGTISDGGFDWPGDTDLENYIDALNPGDSNNASVVEFNFVPLSTNISFDYIFAAEEYGTFQCGYSDAFAFLLTDSSGNTTNLAIVPGTNDPVSVFTVRDNQYNDGCDSVNEEWFGNFYGAGGLPPLISPTNFIGHTEVLTAQADVIPNELYTIKLVIADALDSSFDSAVFIDGGSFNLGQLDLGEDILVSSGNALCAGQEITLDASPLPNNSTIEWFMDGSLIDGQNEDTLVVTQTAFYSATITVDNTNCTYSDDILVEFFEVPNIIPVTNDIVKCANEGFTLEVDVLNSDLLNPLTYIWTLDGVDIQTGPENTYFLSDSAEEFGEFTVTVFDDVTYCWNSTTINVDFYVNSYCVDLPQGLSPNDDGLNDCMILDHLEAEEDIDKVEVFNRYGTKIYELNEYVDQWCGFDNEGNRVPVGTYFYIIYFNSDKEPLTSWIYVNY
jgi:gliding motility-associated-like protein